MRERSRFVEDQLQEAAMFQKAIDRLCRLFSFLMVVSLALMVVMVFGNVVLRYGFNYGTTSAVMEASMAWFYASGVVFAVLAGIIVVHELFRLVTGRIAESELVGVVESEASP